MREGRIAAGSLVAAGERTGVAIGVGVGDATWPAAAAGEMAASVAAMSAAGSPCRARLETAITVALTPLLRYTPPAVPRGRWVVRRNQPAMMGQPAHAPSPAGRAFHTWIRGPRASRTGATGAASVDGGPSAQRRSRSLLGDDLGHELSGHPLRKAGRSSGEPPRARHWARAVPGSGRPHHQGAVVAGGVEGVLSSQPRSRARSTAGSTGAAR